MAEDDALTCWVKKSLESGDNPEIIKEALKNRGHDPAIVDILIKSNVSKKKKIPVFPEPKKEQVTHNAGLKAEVETILNKPSPVSVPREDPLPAQNQLPERTEVTENNPGKKSFRLPLPSLPEFNFNIPKISLGNIDIKTGKYLAISVFVVGLLVVIFLGLNWYADQMAKAVLG